MTSTLECSPRGDESATALTAAAARLPLKDLSQLWDSELRFRVWVFKGSGVKSLGFKGLGFRV